MSGDWKKERGFFEFFFFFFFLHSLQETGRLGLTKKGEIFSRGLPVYEHSDIVALSFFFFFFFFSL